MLKKLLIAAGAAVVGAVIHGVFKNRASERLVDDACDAMNDILKEECRVSVKEKIVDKIQDVRAAGKEIVDAFSQPDICGDEIRITSSSLDENYVQSFVDTQFKYNAFYRNFMTAGKGAIVGGLFAGVVLFGIALKFREIGNVSYEHDLAIHYKTSES